MQEKREDISSSDAEKSKGREIGRRLSTQTHSHTQDSQDDDDEGGKSEPDLRCLSITPNDGERFTGGNFRLISTD